MEGKYSKIKKTPDGFWTANLWCQELLSTCLPTVPYNTLISLIILRSKSLIHSKVYLSRALGRYVINATNYYSVQIDGTGKSVATWMTFNKRRRLTTTFKTTFKDVRSVTEIQIFVQIKNCWMLFVVHRQKESEHYVIIELRAFLKSDPFYVYI